MLRLIELFVIVLLFKFFLSLHDVYLEGLEVLKHAFSVSSRQLRLDAALVVITICGKFLDV